MNSKTEVTPLHQPESAEFVVSKVSELPTRTRPGHEGYDAIGVVVVNCPNDGRAIQLISGTGTPAQLSLFLRVNDPPGRQPVRFPERQPVIESRVDQ